LIVSGVLVFPFWRAFKPRFDTSLNHLVVQLSHDGTPIGCWRAESDPTALHGGMVCWNGKEISQQICLLGPMRYARGKESHEHLAEKLHIKISSDACK